MAGEDRTNEVVDYLSRLLSEVPGADTALQLRSVHRAALASWARKQNVPLQLSVLNSGAPFSIRELLNGNGNGSSAAHEHAAPVAQLPVSVPVAGAGDLAGIGIDIEEVDNLPQADDYREHPFFTDNFTSSEIAYCLRQGDVKASFCGAWAAKEAILKSGLLAAKAGHLRDIEIRRDAAGRPWFQGCHLSISHTPRTAVAVCIAVRNSATLGIAVSQPHVVAAVSAPGSRSRKWPWSRA